MNLYGSIVAENAPERLVSISRGGCGFYGDAESPCTELVNGNKITCVFELGGITLKPIQIESRVAYAKVECIDDMYVTFCGIEFLEQSRDNIKSIIRYIEEREESET